MQAQKALGKSNRIVGGSIMIGVAPCTEPNLDESVANISTLNRSYAPGNVDRDASVTTLNSSLGGARLNSSIRPLTQAYKAAHGEHDVSFPVQ